MAYIEVDENLFNSLLRQSLQNNNTTPKHHNHDYISKKIMGKEAINHSKNITNSMQKQVTVVKNWIKSDKGRTSFDNQELSEDEVAFLENRLNNELRDDNNTLKKPVDDAYDTGKLRGLSNIDKPTIFRSFDDVNKALLEHFNWSYIKKLATDVRQKLYEIVSKGIITGDKINVVLDKLKDFLHTENVGNGFFNTIRRAEAIATDVLHRSSTAGIISAYKDYALKYGNLVINSLNPCDDCLQMYETNPHLLTDLENIIPLHVSCQCTPENLGGEEISQDIVDDPGVTDLTNIVSNLN